MHHFQYQKLKEGEVLHCEDLNLADLAEKVGTPFYCYSQATLDRHFRVFDEAFAEIPHLVCFSVKANSNLAVLNLFAGKGSGFDIVSGGELERILRAGGDPQKVVFAGVGKTRAEMRKALDANILLFNVESAEELHTLQEVASEMGIKARIAIRVNPNIDPKTHPYISTGLRKAKFGIELDHARTLFGDAHKLSHIEVAGVDCHIGSQLTELAPFQETLKSMEALIADLRAQGLNIRYLDIGGGLGITYNQENPPHPSEYAKTVIPFIKKMGVTLILEPGRVIVGNAGILVSRVLYTKKSPSKNFVIMDAAMNDLIRPALYEAHQEIQPVVKNRDKEIVADVVGPICETGDFLALDRKVPDFKANDLVAIMSAGAYSFSMSSTYNTRPRVAEVLVHGHAYEVIRERETVQTLLRGERIGLRQSKLGRSFHVPFTKMHGAGNDFIMIDGRTLTTFALPWEKIAREICDRHFGIGADQMLLIDPPPVQTKDIACTMTIYDADGSRVEMCGNGLRAVALYLWERNETRSPSMKIATMERVVTVNRIGADRYQVDMGEPILEGKKIPVAKDGRILNYHLDVEGKTYPITCVSMGNPHAVIFIEGKVSDYPVTTLGPKIEHHAFFPNRVNVEFVEVLSSSEVRTRVWERGTGETLACGSGACAVVVAGVLAGRTARDLKIHLPGGMLEMQWLEKDNHVLLTGPVARAFDGDVDLGEFSFWKEMTR